MGARPSLYPYNARFLVAARRIMNAALDVTAVQVVGVLLTIGWRFDLYIEVENPVHRGPALVGS